MTIKNIRKTGLLALLLFLCYSGTGSAKEAADPIKIISLTAKYVPESKAVNLHWVAAEEKEQVQYIIERSLDSLHFRMIGETRSSGNSEGQQHYYFYDSRPVGGNMYYRIREIDAGGKQYVTQVVKVSTPVSGMELAQLLLTHDGKELNFAVISPDSSRTNILVADVEGHIKSSFVLDLERGANMRSIYTGNLTPGVYFLQINDQDGGSSVMKKFIIKADMKSAETDSTQ